MLVAALSVNATTPNAGGDYPIFVESTTADGTKVYTMPTLMSELQASTGLPKSCWDIGIEVPTGKTIIDTEDFSVYAPTGHVVNVFEQWGQMGNLAGTEDEGLVNFINVGVNNSDNQWKDDAVILDIEALARAGQTVLAVKPKKDGYFTTSILIGDNKRSVSIYQAPTEAELAADNFGKIIKNYLHNGGTAPAVVGADLKAGVEYWIISSRENANLYKMTWKGVAEPTAVTYEVVPIRTLCKAATKIEVDAKLDYTDFSMTISASTDEYTNQWKNSMFQKCLEMCGGTLTFTAAKGKYLDQIVFTGSPTVKPESVTVDNGTLVQPGSAGANAAIWTAEGKPTSVTFTITGGENGYVRFANDIQVGIKPLNEVTSIADVQGLAAGDRVNLKLNNAFTTFVYGTNTFIADGTGYLKVSKVDLAAAVAGKGLTGNIVGEVVVNGYGDYSITSDAFSASMTKVEATEEDYVPAEVQLLADIDPQYRNGLVTLTGGVFLEWDAESEVGKVYQGPTEFYIENKLATITSLPEFATSITGAFYVDGGDIMFWPTDVEGIVEGEAPVKKIDTFAELQRFETNTHIQILLDEAVVTAAGSDFDGMLYSAFVEDATTGVRMNNIRLEAIAAGKAVSGVLFAKVVNKNGIITLEPHAGTDKSALVAEDVEVVAQNAADAFTNTANYIHEYVTIENVNFVDNWGSYTMTQTDAEGNVLEMLVDDFFGLTLDGSYKLPLSADKVTGILSPYTDGMYAFIPVSKELIEVTPTLVVNNIAELKNLTKSVDFKLILKDVKVPVVQQAKWGNGTNFIIEDASAAMELSETGWYENTFPAELMVADQVVDGCLYARFEYNDYGSGYVEKNIIANDSTVRSEILVSDKACEPTVMTVAEAKKVENHLRYIKIMEPVANKIDTGYGSYLQFSVGEEILDFEDAYNAWAYNVTMNEEYGYEEYDIVAHACGYKSISGIMYNDGEQTMIWPLSYDLNALDNLAAVKAITTATDEVYVNLDNVMVTFVGGNMMNSVYYLEDESAAVKFNVSGVEVPAALQQGNVVDGVLYGSVSVNRRSGAISFVANADTKANSFVEVVEGAVVEPTVITVADINKYENDLRYVMIEKPVLQQSDMDINIVQDGNSVLLYDEMFLWPALQDGVPAGVVYESITGLFNYAAEGAWTPSNIQPTSWVEITPVVCENIAAAKALDGSQDIVLNLNNVMVTKAQRMGRQVSFIIEDESGAIELFGQVPAAIQEGNVVTGKLYVSVVSKRSGALSLEANGYTMGYSNVEVVEGAKVVPTEMTLQAANQPLNDLRYIRVIKPQLAFVDGIPTIMQDIYSADFDDKYMIWPMESDGYTIKIEEDGYAWIEGIFDYSEDINNFYPMNYEKSDGPEYLFMETAKGSKTYVVTNNKIMLNAYGILETTYNQFNTNDYTLPVTVMDNSDLKIEGVQQFCINTWGTSTVKEYYSDALACIYLGAHISSFEGIGYEDLADVGNANQSKLKITPKKDGTFTLRGYATSGGGKTLAIMDIAANEWIHSTVGEKNAICEISLDLEANKEYCVTAFKNNMVFIDLKFVPGAGTGITDVNANVDILNGNVYNLNGMMVRKAGQSLEGLNGLYIINGKKVMIK